MILRKFTLALILSTTMSLLADSPSEKLPVELNGKMLNPLADSDAKAVVLIFLATDCPISNRYAPLVNRIYSAYKEKGIEFYAVYPISSETVEGIEAHRKDFEYKLPALRDTNHFLVKMAEAIVY